MIPEAVYQFSEDAAFHYPKDAAATLTATPAGTTVDFSGDLGPNRITNRVLVQNVGGADIGVCLDGGDVARGRAVVRPGEDLEISIQATSIVVTGAVVAFLVTAFRRL